jgi:hypothetical protein
MRYVKHKGSLHISACHSTEASVKRRRWFGEWNKGSCSVTKRIVLTFAKVYDRSDNMKVREMRKIRGGKDSITMKRRRYWDLGM